jgi:hypothetical protein
MSIFFVNDTPKAAVILIMVLVHPQTSRITHTCPPTHFASETMWRAEPGEKALKVCGSCVKNAQAEYLALSKYHLNISGMMKHRPEGFLEKHG